RVLSRLSLFSVLPPPPVPTLFPYTTLFRSHLQRERLGEHADLAVQNTCEQATLACRVRSLIGEELGQLALTVQDAGESEQFVLRSEEHTSELQSRFDLVCRLLLEKKNHVCT